MATASADAVAEAPDSQGTRLRARPSDGKRPIAQQPPKERGLQAAAQVLDGALTTAQALDQFQVTADQVDVPLFTALAMAAQRRICDFLRTP